MSLGQGILSVIFEHCFLLLKYFKKSTAHLTTQSFLLIVSSKYVDVCYTILCIFPYLEHFFSKLKKTQIFSK